MSHSLFNPQPLAGKSEWWLVSERSWWGARVLHLWHLNSLDAPTVAAAWSCAFAWGAGVKLPGWAPLLVALAAWTAYIGDRLLDAYAGLRMGAEHDLRERHYFHWQHRYALAGCAMAGAGMSAWIIAAMLPGTALVPDSAVGAATLAYFSGVHARRRMLPATQRFLAPLLTKELLVGVLFTTGCLLPTWSQLHVAPDQSWLGLKLLLPAMFFAALAWLNCFAIARWESGGQGTHMKRVRRVACTLGLAGLVTAFFTARAEPHLAALLAMGATSAFLLAVLEKLRERISSLTLRAAADLVLLTPALLLMFPWWRI